LLIPAFILRNCCEFTRSCGRIFPMNSLFKRFLLVVFLSIAFPLSATADWINLSGAENAPNIAEINIEDDHVLVKLEVYVQDLITFEELVPGDLFPEPIPGRPAERIRTRTFSEKVFQIIADDRKLSARLVRVEPRMRAERFSPFAGMTNPATGRPVPGPPEDRRVLYAELVYPFEGTRPDKLTFIPPIGDRGMPAVSIGFVVFHQDVPVIDFRFLPDSAVLDLNWDDPWYSVFQTKALKRWQRGSVMSFLYIEPNEVRHEVLARVRDLQTWIDLDLRGDEYIEPDEFEKVREKVGDFLLDRNPVRIDGRPVKPILDRVAFVDWTVFGSRFLVSPERLAVNTSMIGVILTYLTDEIPGEVTVDWELFSDRIRQVPTSAVDPAGPFPSNVTPEDTIFRWTNYLKTYTPPQVVQIDVSQYLRSWKIPIGTVLCLMGLIPVGWQIRSRNKASRSVTSLLGVAALLVAGSLLLYPHLRMAVSAPAAMAPPMTVEQSRELLHDILKNVYRAFDFREEEDVYDKLAMSVSGDLLEEIYLKNRQSFAVARAGGAQARVREIQILDVQPRKVEDRRLGYIFRAQWTAMGTVGHWGHIHTRKNQYKADITIEPVAGFWKITGLELLEEKRIDQVPVPPVASKTGNR